MRVIAGYYRGRNLRSPPSMQVRPTSDRLRETLFNVLAPRIAGARFLDLCAGSGAVGIEALSRGAAHATFVDRSAETCSFIELNLRQCGVPREHVEVVNSDAIDFLRHATTRESATWDIAFFDPPYEIDYALVLAFFGARVALKRKSGVLVVEHHCDNRLHDTIGVLRRWRLVRRGESCLSFYEQR